MTNLTKIERKILLMEGIFVVGALMYLFFASAPQGTGMTIGNVVDGPIEFRIENGDSILISRDAEFTNPIELQEGDEIFLVPGDYYWKVRGLMRESEVYTFSVKDKVGLNLREGEDNNLLENSGNVPIEVNKKGITSDIPIEIEAGSSEEVKKDDSIYEGRQDG